MNATIPACSGNWSKSNDDYSRGAALVDMPWVERLVRLEERLSALTDRVAKLEAKPSDEPEIIDILTEIGELLAEKIDSKGAGDTLADEIVRTPGALDKLFRRGVYLVFALVLLIISKLLEAAPLGGFSVKFGG